MQIVNLAIVNLSMVKLMKSCIFLHRAENWNSHHFVLIVLMESRENIIDSSYTIESFDLAATSRDDNRNLRERASSPSSFP